MGQMLSPGVQVNEIDLSIVVPQLGNATACFAGVFTKGPSDKFLLITNGEELINYYGYPTNDNYNDWFQAYNFLQYANKLLVSRAVDSNGTYTTAVSNNTVKVVNEAGKVEIVNAPTEIFAGSYIKFTTTADYTGEYKVDAIEAPVTAVAQVSEIDVTCSTLAEGDTIGLEIVYNGSAVASIFTGAVGGSTGEEAATGLASDITADTNGVTAVAQGTKIIITAAVAGVATIFEEITDANLNQITVTTANVEGESYELVLSDYRGATDLDFSEIAFAGSEIYVRNSSMNALVNAPVGPTYTRNAQGVITAIATEATALQSGDELKPQALFIPNDNVYELSEMSIPNDATSKLKFFAKSSGDMQNYTEIAIARQKDFDFGSALVFKGLPLNDFFENKPLESKSEIAVVIRQFGKVTGAYIVSLIPGSKDYRNKSNYIEDIINKYDLLFYVKDNTNIKTMPQSRLYSTVEPTLVVDADTGVSSIKDMPVMNAPLKTSNGANGIVGVDDIINALGNVKDNTIFGNKEELDIDIVIANELARVECGYLASERADCIAFIGAKFGDVVGLQSAIIVENLVKDVMNGDLNNAATANSFCAYFGNYKQQYDKFNDKMRWVSVAGDVAGLRADTNTKLNTWWASAGLDRGQIKNAQKIAFNPNNGQRDMLYKNKVNPVVSFPGQGNAIVWGQKTLQSKPSAFDRINVRGLFNTLERAISRMAKYYLFEFNDAFTRNRFVGTIKPFLESVKAGRGCYDFYIRCDETNNTPTQIDANNFIADIAIKPTRVAEFITLNFVAVGTGVSFGEIFV